MMVNQPTATQIEQSQNLRLQKPNTSAFQKEIKKTSAFQKERKNTSALESQKNKNQKPAVLSFHGRDYGDGKVHNLYIKTLKLEQLVEMLKDNFCLSSRVSTEFHRYDLNFIAVTETDLNCAYDIEI